MTGDVLSARQAALAAELRALYGYALVGPRLDATGRSVAVACLAAHAALRDAAEAAIRGVGGTPVTPRPDYPELYPVDGVTQARTRALDLEQTCAAAWRALYAALVAAGPQVERPAAQRALRDSAVRATRWRLLAGAPAATVPFPGIG